MTQMHHKSFNRVFVGRESPGPGAYPIASPIGAETSSPIGVHTPRHSFGALPVRKPEAARATHMLPTKVCDRARLLAVLPCIMSSLLCGWDVPCQASGHSPNAGPGKFAGQSSMRSVGVAIRYRCVIRACGSRDRGGTDDMDGLAARIHAVQVRTLTSVATASTQGGTSPYQDHG